MSNLTRSESGAPRWRKSTYSQQDVGECLEVSDDFPGIVPVRDSKRPHGPALIFPAAPWAAFVADVVRTARP
ncbi:DUF397 domain-containing protein [Streptomyces sp. NPDC088725]|uniref:DUF397 domain-containing protein n=1 Tax=Streptomyces sp. NPDC088725 TaxID=3365873 RepID=UPI00381FBF15